MNDHRIPLLHGRVLATLSAGLLFAAVSMFAATVPAVAAPSVTPSSDTPSAGPIAAAPPATVSGTACLPGQGVTIGVDFAPVTDGVKVGCAVGEQATMAAAGSAAGFTFAPTTGFLTTIDGVVSPAAGFWSVYITTADGNPGGTLTSTWTFAQTGIDGGPLAVDTVLLFDLVPDSNAAPETPRISPVELTAVTAAATGSAASNTTASNTTASNTSSANSASSTDTGSGSTVTLVVVAVVVLIALGVAAVFISRRRSARSDD